MLNIGLLYMGGQASAIGLCDGVLRFDTVMSRCTRYIYSNPLILPTALSPPPTDPPHLAADTTDFPFPSRWAGRLDRSGFSVSDTAVCSLRKPLAMCLPTGSRGGRGDLLLACS